MSLGGLGILDKFASKAMTLRALMYTGMYHHSSLVDLQRQKQGPTNFRTWIDSCPCFPLLCPRIGSILSCNPPHIMHIIIPDSIIHLEFLCLSVDLISADVGLEFSVQRISQLRKSPISSRCTVPIGKSVLHSGGPKTLVCAYDLPQVSVDLELCSNVMKLYEV